MICFVKAIVCETIIKQSCGVPENHGGLLNTALSMCEKTSMFWRSDVQFTLHCWCDFTDTCCPLRGYSLRAARAWALGIGITHPLR